MSDLSKVDAFLTNSPHTIEQFSRFSRATGKEDAWWSAAFSHIPIANKVKEMHLLEDCAALAGRMQCSQVHLDRNQRDNLRINAGRLGVDLLEKYQGDTETIGKIKGLYQKVIDAETPSVPNETRVLELPESQRSLLQQQIDLCRQEGNIKAKLAILKTRREETDPNDRAALAMIDQKSYGLHRELWVIDYELRKIQEYITPETQELVSQEIERLKEEHIRLMPEVESFMRLQPLEVYVFAAMANLANL